jgi:hypothetical protein
METISNEERFQKALSGWIAGYKRQRTQHYGAVDVSK